MFLPNLKKILYGYLVVFIIAVILLLSTSCKLLEESQNLVEVQNDTGSNPIESEVINQEETSQEDSQTNQEETSQEYSQIEAGFTDKETLEEEPQEISITIKVYYVDEQAQYIVGENREISGRTKEELIVAAFNELLKAPSQENLYNLIPQGTEIINAEFIDNYAFINLSSQFIDNKVDDGLVDNLVINCIAATMTEIPNIRGVVFKVNWGKIDLYGTLDVTNPVIKNQDLIKN